LAKCRHTLGEIIKHSRWANCWALKGTGPVSTSGTL
jgi:hypothetical protein